MNKKQKQVPLVSVIVPVFNVEGFVGQCLRSIHNQTYQNLDIILVNDGSTDGSPRICQEWAKKDNRIKVINENNSGLSAARNKGLTFASGQYILFVDSDDWLVQDAIEVMVNAFNKYNADMVTCQFFNYDGTSHVSFKPSKEVEILNREEYVHKLLMDREITNHIWRKMFKKDLMPPHPFWEGHMFEDIAAMPLLINGCKRFVSLSSPLYYYRLRSSSFIRTPSRFNVSEHYKSTKRALQLYQELDLATNEELTRYGFACYWTAFCDMKRFNIKDKKLAKLLIQEIRQYSSKLLPGRGKIICLCLKIMPASANVLWRFV